jgi:hypothetical protein
VSAAPPRGGLTQALGRMKSFKVTRRDMVSAFCLASGFVVPRNFDIAQPVAKLVAVDVSATPPVLVSRSSYLESEVIAFITQPDNAHRAFRVFDFKRLIELHYPGTGKKLLKGVAFEWSTGAPPAAA